LLFVGTITPEQQSRNQKVELLWVESFY